MLATTPVEILVTLKEAAKRLSLSQSFLRKQIRANVLPHLRVGTRIRFRAADLDWWGLAGLPTAPPVTPQPKNQTRSSQRKGRK